MIDGIGGLTRYDYGGSGQLAQVIDDIGNTTTVLTDAYGRKLALYDPDLGTSSYHYNAFGELVATANAAESVVNTIDIIGRQTHRVVSYLRENRPDKFLELDLRRRSRRGHRQIACGDRARWASNDSQLRRVWPSGISRNKRGARWDHHEL